MTQPGDADRGAALIEAHQQAAEEFANDHLNADYYYDFHRMRDHSYAHN